MTTARAVVAAMAVSALAGWLVPAASAQHGHAHAHGDGGGGHRAVQACLAEFDAVVASGRGAGLAFAADQQGYPGPLHALELKAVLKLTPDQEARLHDLMAAMFGESRPRSARLLEAEERLRRVFAGGAAREADVRAAVADVERARADLRLVHLLTHLRTRDILSEEQRRLYQHERWGAAR